MLKCLNATFNTSSNFCTFMNISTFGTFHHFLHFFVFLNTFSPINHIFAIQGYVKPLSLGFLKFEKNGKYQLVGQPGRSSQGKGLSRGPAKRDYDKGNQPDGGKLEIFHPLLTQSPLIRNGSKKPLLDIVNVRKQTVKIAEKIRNISL